MAAPGIIFDLDGTLADTLEDITESIAFAIKPAFPELVLTPDVVRPWVSEGTRKTIQELTGCRDERIVAEAVRRFRVHYPPRATRHAKLFEGWVQALDELTRMGIPMSVLSNKPQEPTTSICEALLGRWRFVEYAGQRDGVPTKPDPAPALRLCESMGVKPEESLFVGDSGVDVETARKSGMKPVTVAWGYREPSELWALAPFAMLGRPAELGALLTP